MDNLLSDDIQQCLHNAYDMHVHSAPDVMPRKADDFELARRARAVGMGGFVLKSHHVPTADRATLVNQIVAGVTVYGSITLNNFVGGLNPQAVDIAGRLGAKVVWLPTVDAANEADKLQQKDPKKLPYWAKIQQELAQEGHLRPPIDVVDAHGNLVAELYEIMDLIRQHNMVLATGHLSPAEIGLVVRAAHARGLERIVVTHPEFPTTRLTLAQQRELAQYGVYFERCYTTAATGKISWDEMVAGIRETGAARNILSTDLGQPQALFPDEGLADFVRILRAHNVTVPEIQMMMQTNPRRLLQ
jgi:sugar phosphate isomerase/epimerase